MTKSIVRGLLFAASLTALLCANQPLRAAVSLEYVDAILGQSFVADSSSIDPLTGLAFTDFFGGVFPGANGTHFAFKFPITNTSPSAINLTLSEAVLGSDPTPVASLGQPNPGFAVITKGSSLTVGFQSAVVVNAPGASDIFIREIGFNAERADVFVLTTDPGASFELFAQLLVGDSSSSGNGVKVNITGEITEFAFDLEGTAFSSKKIQAIRIVGDEPSVGLTNGFDLANVQAQVEPFENGVTPPTGDLPEPTSLAIWSIGALCVGWRYRRRILKQS